MIAYTREQLRRLLKIDFIRFCIVGGVGFVINLVLLTALHKILHVEIFIAQLISSEIALFSNFMLHHNWTYKHNKVEKTTSNLLLQFHATSWPAILGSSLMVGAGVRFLNLSSFAALVMASVIVLAWNFVWSKYVIWRDVSDKDVKEASL